MLPPSEQVLTSRSLAAGVSHTLDLCPPQRPFIFLLHLAWLVPADSSPVALPEALLTPGLRIKQLLPYVIGSLYSMPESEVWFCFSFPLVLLFAWEFLRQGLRLASHLEPLHFLQLPRAWI